LENALKNWERKKKRIFLPFWLLAQLSSSALSLGPTRSRPAVRGPFSFPRVPLGPSPASRLDARAPSFSLSSLTPQAYLSGMPSSSPRRRQISFLVHHRSNPSPISLPSLFRAQPGYISRMPHPSAPSCTEAEDRHRAEEAMLEP
jgi:hypothetical protein